MAHSNLLVPTALNMKGDVAGNWKSFKDQWQNCEIACLRFGTERSERKIGNAESRDGKDCYEILQRLPDSESHTTVKAKTVHDYNSKCAMCNDFSHTNKRNH